VRAFASSEMLSWRTRSGDLTLRGSKPVIMGREEQGVDQEGSQGSEWSGRAGEEAH